LRQESLEFLFQYVRDGIAIGGVSVGEERAKIEEVIEYTAPKLPKDKPRYLM